MKKIFYIAIAALSLSSCDLADNADPNNPTEAQLSPRQLLAAAETGAYTAQTTGMYALSNIWLNTWAGNQYYFASPLSREYQLDLSSTFYPGIFNETYLAAANLSSIINNKASASLPYHAAIAKILLANSMQYMVDFYGDVPYSQAFQQQANLSPKYDKGEDVYHDLVVKLNEAIALIESNPIPSDAQVVNASEDVIFGGDMIQWVKYANSLKLRILLRQSKVTDATVAAFRDAQLTSLIGKQLVNSDVTINPGYSTNTADQQNPLYRNYGYLIFDSSGQNVNGYRLYDAADHIAKLLMGDASKPTSGVPDPRRAGLFRTVGGVVKGIVQGAAIVPGNVESSISRMSWKYYQAAETGSAINGYLMTKAESEFLQSEAAVLYPAKFTNASGHYTQGVTDSFTFYGYTAASATTYLGLLNSKPVGWTGAVDKMAAIQYQRLIALTYTRPMETYLNYLKTGYPDTPLALTALKPNKPLRLIYPSREYTANAANVPNITAADVFVKNQYTPFWNRN